MISSNEMYNPEVICFCDIPDTDREIHMRKYSRFGISFLKAFLIKKGANPVFYVAMNSMTGNDFQGYICRSKYFDNMVREYHEFFRLLMDLIMQQRRTPGVQPDFNRLMEIQRFFDFHIFSFLKFYDDSKPDKDPNNFYMEREWRILGNLEFKLDDINRVILPKTYAARFRQEIPNYIGQLTLVD